MQLSCRLPRKGQKMRINPLAPQDHIYLWTTSRRGKWRVCNTLTRVEADITSLLGTQAPTELCCKKCCRRIRQASISHNQPGMLNIHQGIGGGSTTVWRDGNPGQCLVPVRPVLEYQYVLAVIREQTMSSHEDYYIYRKQSRSKCL